MTRTMTRTMTRSASGTQASPTPAARSSRSSSQPVAVGCAAGRPGWALTRSDKSIGSDSKQPRFYIFGQARAPDTRSGRPTQPAPAGPQRELEGNLGKACITVASITVGASSSGRPGPPGPASPASRGCHARVGALCG